MSIKHFLGEGAIEAVRNMLAKGTDKEDIPDAPGFFVSAKRQRLCISTIEVDGKQYFICQRT